MSQRSLRIPERRYLIKSVNPEVDPEKLWTEINKQCAFLHYRHVTAIAVGEGFVSVDVFNKLSEHFHTRARSEWQKFQKVLDDNVVVVEIRPKRSYNSRLAISFHNMYKLYGQGYHVDADCLFSKIDAPSGTPMLGDQVFNIIDTKHCIICKQKASVDEATFDRYNDELIFYDCDFVHKVCLERRLVKYPETSEYDWCGMGECYRLDLTPLLGDTIRSKSYDKWRRDFERHTEQYEEDCLRSIMEKYLQGELDFDTLYRMTDWGFYLLDCDESNPDENQHCLELVKQKLHADGWVTLRTLKKIMQECLSPRDYEDENCETSCTDDELSNDEDFEKFFAEEDYDDDDDDIESFDFSEFLKFKVDDIALDYSDDESDDDGPDRVENFRLKAFIEAVENYRFE